MSEDLDIEAGTAPPEAPRRRMTGDRLARVILWPLLAVLGVVVLVFYVMFGTSEVVGPSMLPTLRTADRLLITHGDTSPARGDVIVTMVDEKGTPVELVKRVIGVAGDTVAIKNDVAFVNGVQEPERGQVIVKQYSDSFPPVTVPNGSIYVMGDNRAVSEDSRYIGPVPVSGIKGRVVWIFSPITRIAPVH